MMFKLNTLQRTKSGELLMPFTVNGDIVSCFNSKKQTVYRKLDDFDFTPEPKEDPVFSVVAKEDLNTDVIFEEEVVNDGFNEQVAEMPPVDDSTSSGGGDVTDTPDDTGASGTDTTTDSDATDTDSSSDSGSIWDTVNDDDYI